jgi:hypothetical protein
MNILTFIGYWFIKSFLLVFCLHTASLVTDTRLFLFPCHFVLFFGIPIDCLDFSECLKLASIFSNYLLTCHGRTTLILISTAFPLRTVYESSIFLPYSLFCIFCIFQSFFTGTSLFKYILINAYVSNVILRFSWPVSNV